MKFSKMNLLSKRKHRNKTTNNANKNTAAKPSSSTTTTMTASPKDLGYTFPDEWEARAGTMMIFPSQYHYRKGNELAGIRKEICDIANSIAIHEKIHMFCTKKDRTICQQLLFRNNNNTSNHNNSTPDNITIHTGGFHIDWARDNAPLLLRSKCGNKLMAADFRCNGWGKKYWGWRWDKNTRSNIANIMGWSSFPSRLVLEGGSVEIANGVAIATEQCVLHKNRTNWSKDKVENELKRMLGLDKVIWLPSGLVPDPHTDGHVDGLVKWIRHDTVMLHTINDEDASWDPDNYAICQHAKRILLSHNLTVVELPLADDISRVNFYIGGGGQLVYVPICGDPEHDEPVLEILRQHFTTVVPILATHLNKAGGGIHCVTQQIPAVRVDSTKQQH